MYFSPLSLPRTSKYNTAMASAGEGTRLEPIMDHDSSKAASEKEEPTPRSNSPEASHDTVAEEQKEEGENKRNIREDGKRELTEQECYDKLAYCWPTWKKWMLLCSVAGIQISMNFNTSVFPNAVNPLAAYWRIGAQEARVGQMIYLVLYSFGCELWAPWSEEFGRWPILQLSMFLINIWQIPCALAPNWGTIVVCRALVSRIGRIIMPQC